MPLPVTSPAPARPDGPASAAGQARPPVRPWVFAAGAAALIALLAVPGALTVRRGGGGAFDLDGELTIPALASALLLLCAAGAAALAHRRDPRPSRRPWAALAVLFAVMAVDEAAGLHEGLEDLSAVDWQTIYVPVVLLAGIAWLLGLARMQRRERAAFVLGAGAWCAAQVLEALEWTGPREAERAVDGYGIMMGAEELLEMTGSALFTLALLLAVERWSRR